MEREGQKKMWYFINRSQKDPRSKAVHIVQRVSAKDGTIEDSTTKEDTEDFIFAENEYRFQLANDAPISSTKLIEQLGYLADSDIAQQIVEGSFEIPDELDDDTALILEEIGRIGVQLRTARSRSRSQRKNFNTSGRKFAKTQHHRSLAFTMATTRLLRTLKRYLNSWQRRSPLSRKQAARQNAGVMASR